MTTITTARQGAAALALASLAAEALAWALRSVLAPALALLLTACGYRPARPPQAPQAPPKQLKPAAAPIRPIEARPSMSGNRTLPTSPSISAVEKRSQGTACPDAQLTLLRLMR